MVTKYGIRDLVSFNLPDLRTHAAAEKRQALLPDLGS